MRSKAAMGHLAGLIALAFVACTQVSITNLNPDDFEGEVTTPTTPVFSTIVAIGQERCTGCHVGGGAQGGFNFDPDDGVAPDGAQAVLDQMISSGLVITSAPSTSPFLKKPLNESDGDTHPSPFADTSDEDYLTILEWVTDGAPLTASTTTPKSFSTDVVPIFTASCATTGCHVTGGAGLPNLEAASPTLYSDVATLVTAGNGENSDLVLSASGGNSHPPGEVLAPNSSDLNVIITWINEGAEDN